MMFYPTPEFELLKEESPIQVAYEDYESEEEYNLYLADEYDGDYLEKKFA